MIRHRICLLFNNLFEFDFEELVQRFLPMDQFEVDIVDIFPKEPSKYQFIIPWNYRKVIQKASQAGNVIVMHSSELPEGRGWAPIYHAFSEQKSHYVMTCVFADDDVDTGDIIMQARFVIEPDYTAPFTRMLDNELSLLLIVKLCEQWPGSNPVGAKQTGTGSYRSRRYPADNEVDISQSLASLIPHLRAVESSAPAFFIYNNVKYLIEVRPVIKPSRPSEVFIEYPALDRVDVWRDWAVYMDKCEYSI